PGAATPSLPGVLTRRETGPAPTMAPGGGVSTDLLPRQLRRAVSPYTGIVRSLEECLQSSTDPPLHQFAAEVGARAGGGRGRAGPFRPLLATAACTARLPVQAVHARDPGGVGRGILAVRTPSGAAARGARLPRRRRA